MADTPTDTRRSHLFWRFLLSIAIIGALLAAVYYTERTRYDDKLAIAQANSLNDGANAVRAVLHQVASDLRILARLPALQNVLTAPDAANDNRLNETFRTFAEERRLYDQIRYIDAAGRERARINFNNGQASIVPPPELSDKSARDYFKRTMATPAGHIVVTPFNLNIEHGHIERPYKPVVRFALRVQDRSGHAHGIVVLNYLGAALHHQLAERVAHATGTVTLMNQHGRLLITPDARRDWSFLLPPGIFFSHTHPGVWQHLKADPLQQAPAQHKRQFWQHGNLYSYTVLSPNVIANGQAGPADSPIRWFLLARIDHSSIAHAMAPLRQRLVLLFVLGVAISAFTTLWLARNRANTNRLLRINRRSEQERQAKDRLLNLFIWNVPAAVAMFDTEMRYLSVSRRWYEDYRIEEQELIGKGLYAVFPEITQRWRDIHQRCLAGAVEHCDEDPFERPDGTIDWLRWEVRPWYRSDSTIGGIIMLTENITERKRQTALQDEFVAKVSHELRTPLTVIHGALRLLNAGVALPGKDTTQELLQTAERNTDRLLHLVNDLLDLQRAKLNQLNMQHTRLKLNTVIAEAVETNRSLGASRNVSLDYAQLPSTPETAQETPQSMDAPRDIEVLGDTLRIGQVITNLLANAVRYSPDNATVRVRLEQTHDGAWVSVEDQGPGIPEHLAEQLFDQFTQGEQGDTRSTGGSGLGLAISKAIIEQLGGTIGFENRAEGGARVFFRLPIAGQHTATH